MTDRPILFSGPMVRALLDSRKTQTRRPVSPRNCTVMGGRLLPIWKPGDRLWVREAWAPLSDCFCADPGTTALICGGFHRADYSEGLRQDDGSLVRWRPSIHMPRSASRLTLIVTDVRVQRLQDISKADAIAEGIDLRGSAGLCGWRSYRETGRAQRNFADPRDSFQTLWDSINAKRAQGWDANPWVVATAFQPIADNIDSLEKAT